MEHRSRIRISFILVLLVLLTADFIHADSKCRTTCSGSRGSYLQYEEGTTYVYNLEGNTETLVPKATGPNGDSTKLNIKAQVEVSVLPECATLIKLKGVQVVGPDTKKYGNLVKLEENPLRVSLNGGHLGNEICTVPEDDYSSLNIKRAVASLLQVNAPQGGGSVHEVDVFGDCPTDFRVNKDGDVTVVQKHRNLNKCSYREDIRQELYAITHSGSAEFQSSPLLDSHLVVEQRIKAGVIESAVAKESYLFKPFANRDNGAKSRVTTKLTLVSKSKGSISGADVSEPRSIFFENPHEVVSSNIQTVLSSLHKVVDDLVNSVSPTSPKDFSNFVNVLRRASKDDLLSVYGQVKAGAGFKNKQIAKRVFTDALFRSGSADSVAVAMELLKSGEIEGNFARVWYLTFPFVRHVSSSSLAAANSLLDEADLPREAYLGIGGLAGKYCREHNCENVPEFNQLLGKLSAAIPSPVPSSRKDENKIISVLKALRNIHKLNDESAVRIAQVIKDTKAPVRVRAAALETAQSDACRGKLQKAVIDTLFNREEDSELRIKAYLVLIECPTTKSANKLSELLEDEPVNQVGSFITSHLRNLRASANPDRQVARQVYGNIRPKRKYPIDFRKFSQNIEFSYNIDALNTAAGIESNVIFSQNSYLPRSVNLNLTAEVFGHAFNFLEIGGRAENLERLLERYFGPKGYLKTHQLNEVYNKGSERVKNIYNQAEEKYKNLLRNRRSVTRQQTDELANQVHLHRSEYDNNIDVDLSLRVLGNELAFVNLGDNTNPLNPESVIDQIANYIERGIGKTKQFDYDFKNHLLFLDSELTYPTGLGFPLRLTASGSSIVHFKVGGQLDIGAALKNPKNGEFNVKLIPSAAVEVVGQLTIDGYAVETGVKVSATLHTSTGTDVTVRMLDGHGFDVNVGLPVEKADLITLESQVLSVVRERGQPQVGTPLTFDVPRRDFHGCFDQLSAIVGLTFCGDLGFPFDQQPLVSNAALYPLNGHSKISVRVEKEDASLKNYYFKFYFNKDDPKHRSLEVTVDTPGSNTNRKLSVLAELKTEPDKEVKINVVSPFVQLLLQGLLIDNEREHSLSGKFKFNENVEYSAKIGLNVNGQTYTPVIEYHGSSGPDLNVQVEGSVTVDKRGDSPYRKYTFNNVKLTTPGAVFTIDGTITKDVNSFFSDIKLGYDQHHIAVKSKLQKLGEANYKVSGEIVPSQFPDFGLGLKWEYQRDKEHLENNLVVTHGPDLNSAVSRMSLFQQFHYKAESAQNFDFSTKQTLTYPLFAIDGRFEGAVTRKSLSYELEVGYEKHKLKSRLAAKTGVNKPGDYEISLTGSAFEYAIRVSANREILGQDRSKFTNRLQLTPGGTYELVSDVTYQFERNNINSRAVTTLRLEGAPEPYNLDFGLVYNPNLFDGHFKVAVGPNEYLVSSGKYNRGSQPSGSFTLQVRNLLQSDGSFSYTNGKGKGELLIDFVKLGRKIKGTGDLTVAGNNYDVVAELLVDADRDPTKKISLTASAQVTKAELKYRSTADVFGYHFQADVGVLNEGTPRNGKVVAVFDLILPNNRQVIFGFGKSTNLKAGDNSLRFFGHGGTAAARNTPGHHLQFEYVLENADFRKYTGKTSFEFNVTCPHDVHAFKQSAQSTLQDNKYVIDLGTEVTGTKIAGYNSNVHVTADKNSADFTVHANYGDSLSLDGTGKLVLTKNRYPEVFETTLELKTPLEAVKTLKYYQILNVEEGSLEDSTPYKVKSTDEVVINGGSPYKLTYEVSAAKYDIVGKAEVNIPNEKPYSFQGRYKYRPSGDSSKGEVGVAAIHGEDTIFDIVYKVDYKKDLSHVSGHLTGLSSRGRIQKLDLQFTHKRQSDITRLTDAKITVNDITLDITSKADLSVDHPVLDVVVVSGEGKNRFYIKIDRKGEREGTAEGQILWTAKGGGKVDYSVNVDVQSIDNFVVTARVNSEVLKLNKLRLEVGNRAAKSGTGRRINFVAQTADKQGFTGSATYALKETDVGYSVEGKGNINIKNDNHPLTYKLVVKKLQQAVDKETGGSVTLNIDYAKTNILYVQKISDKENKAQAKYCKEAECSEFSFYYRPRSADLTEFHQETSLLIDNKLFGRNDYIKVLSSTKRKGLIFDQENSLQLKNQKYVLKNYLHNGEAGVVAETPQREVAIIATFEIPGITSQDRKPNSLQGKTIVNVFLDRKKNPTDKSTLTLNGDITKLESTITLNSEARFSHPSIQKDLVLKGRGQADIEKITFDASTEIDIFTKKNQRIIFNVKLDHNNIGNTGHNVTGKLELLSKGLVIDLGLQGHAYASLEGVSFATALSYSDDKNTKKSTGVYFEADPHNLFALVSVPNRELLRVVGKSQVSDNERSLDGEVQVAGYKTIVGNVKFTGLNLVTACVHTKEEPNKKLQASVGITQQQVEMKAVRVIDDKKDELIHLNLKLDQTSLVKLDYNLNTDNVKDVLEYLKNLANELVNKMKELVSELAKELTNELQTILENAKKAQPNIKPLVQAYETQLKALRDELLADPSVKEVTDIVRNLVGGVAEAISEFVVTIGQICQKTLESLKVLQENVINSFKKGLPGLEKAYQKLLHTFSELLQNLIEYGTVSLKKLLEFVKQYEGEFKEILQAATEIFQDVGRLAVKTFNQLKNELQEFINLLVDQIKALPIYSMIQEKIQELRNLQLPDTFFHAMHELATVIQDSLPTQELRDLVTSVVNYIEKRLKREPVDDVKEIKGISELAVKALKSLLELVKQYYTTEDATSLLGYSLNFNIPLPTAALYQIPKLGKFRFSPISLLFSDDLPTASDYYYTYKPTLNPLDYVPPYKAYGLLVNSHHFFTFDRKHYSFKGSCSYVLAQDFQDGNFSIVANLEGGKLKSITVNDRTDTIELLNDNTAVVNGKPSDYPIYQNDFNGWRRYTSVNLKSKSGIFIQKDLVHDVYIFRVSGFYHGKTRGLLGTINNEHYDEFILPNGKIANDAAEFANAYKIGSCGDAPAVPSVEGHAAECTQLLTSDSPLRGGFKYVNPEPYREACDQHVATSSDKLHGACNIAAGYVTALLEEHYSAQLPPECKHCTVGGKHLEIGQTEPIQSPVGKADVVIVVEQSTQNTVVFNELVTPLIASLSNDLKEKGLGDVQFALIGFGGPNKKYPQHITNNGKITYEGQADKMTFAESDDVPVKPPYDTFIKKVRFIKEIIDTELGLQQIVVAMNEANLYPFRAGASKTIILVNTTPCPKSALFPFSLQIPRIFNINRYYRTHGLNFFIVSPLESLKLINKPEQKLKNLVGFDKTNIYTLADAKKKPLTGDPNDREHLQFTSDLCIEFAQSYGGATFNSHNFIDSKPEQRKKFVNVVSQRVVNGILEYQYEEECTCRMHLGLYSYARCKVVSREKTNKGR